MINAVMTNLPTRFSDWFAARAWHAHDHQLAMLDAAKAGEDALLIAPTGGGKTLAGFLPSLVDIAQNEPAGLHTLYISPLKALAVDIERNLKSPITEMGLPITVETRTGDTPQRKRKRQREKPPHLLLTTPESLALLLSYAEAPRMFRRLRTVIIDELHALAGTKRGDLLALCIARLSTLAKNSRRIGLSATVAWPEELSTWLSPKADPGTVRRIVSEEAIEPEIRILETQEQLPWSGHMATHALPEILSLIHI